MKYTKTILTLGGALINMSTGATVLEDFQFNENPGVGLTDLVNGVATSSLDFASGKDQMTTDGAGFLETTVGLDATDNVFRSAALTTKDVTSGVYTMEFTITSASFSAGLTNGGNIGFGIRDETGADLFIVRLQNQNDTVRLQTRVNTTTTNIENFGLLAINDLAVTTTFDLDSDTLDVAWQLGSGVTATSGSQLGIAFSNLQMDELRFVANTNTDQWGATDEVNVDFFTLSQIPEPTSSSLIALSSLALLRRKRA